MKKLLIPVILALPLALVLGCGGGDETVNPPQPPADSEVLEEAWDAYTAGDYAEAEVKFNELVDRGRLLAEAHDGLGWTAARQDDPGGALLQFVTAIGTGADTLAIKDEVFAGLAFVNHALGSYASCLDAAAEVAADWVFVHEGALGRDDLTVLEAASHYALGQFADALATVQQLDPSFDADVETVAGRAALAARIESLFS